MADAGTSALRAHSSSPTAAEGPLASQPGLPARPGSAQQVGVRGLVDQALHLSLCGEATLGLPGPDVVIFVSCSDSLQVPEGRCVLVAQEQLVAGTEEVTHVKMPPAQPSSSGACPSSHLVHMFLLLLT